MRAHRWNIIIAFALFLVLLSCTLFGNIQRGNGGFSASVTWGRRTLMLRAGTQSVCPPIVQCPRSLDQPPGIALWLLEGDPKWLLGDLVARTTQVVQTRLWYKRAVMP